MRECVLRKAMDNEVHFLSNGRHQHEARLDSKQWPASISVARQSSSPFPASALIGALSLVIHPEIEQRRGKSHDFTKTIFPQAQEHSESFPQLLGPEERFSRAEPIRNQAKMPAQNQSHGVR